MKKDLVQKKNSQFEKRGTWRKNISEAEKMKMRAALDKIYKLYICIFGKKRTEIENEIMKMCINYNTEETKK